MTGLTIISPVVSRRLTHLPTILSDRYNTYYQKLKKGTMELEPVLSKPRSCTVLTHTIITGDLEIQ